MKTQAGADPQESAGSHKEP